MTFDPVIHQAAALVPAYVFILAGLHKCRAPREFALTLENYRVLPGWLNRQCVYLIPVAEIMTGVALALPPTARPAAWSATILLGAYTAAIGVNLRRGRRDMDCGCSGPRQKQTLDEWMLVRNGLLLLLAFIAACQAQPRPLLWLDWTVVFLAAAAGSLCYNIVNQLLANRDLLKNLQEERRHA